MVAMPPSRLTSTSRSRNCDERNVSPRVRPSLRNLRKKQVGRQGDHPDPAQQDPGKIIGHTGEKHHHQTQSGDERQVQQQNDIGRGNALEEPFAAVFGFSEHGIGFYFLGAVFFWVIRSVTAPRYRWGTSKLALPPRQALSFMIR